MQPLTTHTLPASCLLDAAGTIEIPVLRHGSDLSSLTSVWCATRPSEPPSASPGVDYIPSSKKVEFKPGKTEEVRAEKMLSLLVLVRMQAASLLIAGFAAMSDTKRHKRQNIKHVLKLDFIHITHATFSNLFLGLFKMNHSIIHSSIHHTAHFLILLSYLKFSSRHKTKK